MDILRDFAERAISQFRFYEQQHRDKNTVEGMQKAEVNKSMAEQGEYALSESDFTAKAMRTAPPEGTFHAGKLWEAHLFAQDLLEYIEASRKIDRWKSVLIYGKEKDPANYDVLPAAGDLDKSDFSHLTRIDGGAEIAHAILGISSEGGELAEHLLAMLLGEPLDKIAGGINEETGDVDWFQELLGVGLGIPVHQSRADVIHKLQRRFPEKFTQEHAVARLDKVEGVG